MNLVQTIFPLLQAGNTLQFSFSASSNGQVSLIIAPRSEAEGKGGIAIPTQALTGTPSDIDAGLEEYMAGYIRPAMSISEQSAAMTAAMQKAAEDAKAKVEEKKSTPSRPAKGVNGATKTTASKEPELLVSAGTASEDGGVVDNDDEEGDKMPSGGNAVAGAGQPMVLNF